MAVAGSVSESTSVARVQWVAQQSAASTVPVGHFWRNGRVHLDELETIETLSQDEE
jgi:hypothetical protein